jgi:hypothetical protein
LAARNCHAPTVFVAAAWSSARGPFFFDNIVAGDGSRRQARLMDRLDHCQRLGKYYAPILFLADKDGCVADDKPYGACTVEATYYDHVGVYSAFTAEWDKPPQSMWWPGKPGRQGCGCETGFNPLWVGNWEIPLGRLHPPRTHREDCMLAANLAGQAVPRGGNHCNEDPPSLDVNEREWLWDYITTMEGKVWKQKGSAWKLEGKGSSIINIIALDPDTGERVKAKAAAHTNPDRKDPNLVHIVFTTALVEKNHFLKLFTCTRK